MKHFGPVFRLEFLQEALRLQLAIQEVYVALLSKKILLNIVKKWFVCIIVDWRQLKYYIE